MKPAGELYSIWVNDEQEPRQAWIPFQDAVGMARAVASVEGARAEVRQGYSTPVDYTMHAVVFDHRRTA